MSTEKEAGFPIEDFTGIDRQVDREDLEHRHFHSLENLWEPKLGVVETRPGSEALADNLPSNIVGLDEGHRIYKSSDDKERVVAVHCERDHQILSEVAGGAAAGPLPAGVTVTLVDDLVNGNWHRAVSAETKATPHFLVLRFVGYGVDWFWQEEISNITGYNGATFQRLEVNVASVQDENVTGIEVFGCYHIGSLYSPPGSGLPLATDVNRRMMSLWIGHCDLHKTATGTFVFYTSPVGYSGAGVLPIDFQPGQRTFNYFTSFDPAGELIPGKTYYIDVLAQYAHLSNAAGNPLTCYRQTGITSYVPITVPEGHNAVNIDTIAPATAVYLTVIGETPQTMIPYEVHHEAITSINRVPSHRPCLVDLKRINATTDDLIFKISDFSMDDMLMNIKDDGSFFPVFISRLHRYANSDVQIEDQFIRTWQNAGSFHGFHTEDFAHTGGFSEVFDYVSWDRHAFFVSTHDPKGRETPTSINFSGTNFVHRTGTAYYITDGLAAGVVCLDYQAAPEVRLPSGPLIQKYQESIMITGGDPTVDQTDNSLSDSSTIVYFSRAINPYDFTVPGAGSPTLQFFSTETGGEKNSGMALYTNTSGTSGPIGQLVITKQSSSWILTDIPVASGGSLPNTFMNNLSNKVGSLHKTMVNTPIGLIASSFENCYLIRDTGEPMPIGDSIAPLIQGAEMGFATATYHDEHYKLSFYHPDFEGTSGFNNIELWLDIEKMKAMKGQPSWKGPMTGRQIDYHFVEDLQGDGDSYLTGRNRIAVDSKGLRVFKADVYPEAEDDIVYDFSDPVVSIMETKDYEVTQQDSFWNKLVKRHYWKVRTNRTKGLPLKASEETWIDGELADQQTLYMSQSAGAFDSKPLKIFPFFPTARIRGRTIRKKLTTKYRIGIGGFVLFYQVERRRI
jgi:hypothetical protein